MPTERKLRKATIRLYEDQISDLNALFPRGYNRPVRYFIDQGLAIVKKRALKEGKKDVESLAALRPGSEGDDTGGEA